MRRAVILLALATAVALSACGVRTSGSAEQAPADGVPFGLLDGELASEPATQPTRGTSVDVYFYDSASGLLVRSPVMVEETDIDTVVRQLQDLPGAQFPGMPSGNPLGDSDVIRSVTLRRGIATVDLSPAFADISGAGQLAALAEIVYTATARPGVGQVAFTLDGAPVEVPTGDGSLSSQPVTRSDYPDVAPEG